MQLKNLKKKRKIHEKNLLKQEDCGNKAFKSL